MRPSSRSSKMRRARRNATLVGQPQEQGKRRESDARGGIERKALRSDSPKRHAQIVCRHFNDRGDREPGRLRDCNDRLEVSQTPGRIAIAKATVERFVA